LIWTAEEHLGEIKCRQRKSADTEQARALRRNPFESAFAKIGLPRRRRSR
jgi:hypothetical protein